MIKKVLQTAKSKRAKNFVIYGIGQGVNLISPLLVMPYLISVCGKDGLGKIGIGFAFSLIFNVLLDYGSYINGTKEIAINRNDSNLLNQKITSIYLMKFYLLLFLMVIAFLMVTFIPYFHKEQAVFYFSFLYVIGQFLNPTWIFQGTENYIWISFINIISKIIYVCAIFFCIKQSSDYVYVNAYLGLGLIFSSLAGLIFIIKKHKIKYYSGASADAFLLIKSEFSLTFSQLFLSFYQYLPIIIIGYLGGNTMAGQYRIIDQVVMVFRTYLQMFFNFVYADVCLQLFNNFKKGIQNWYKYYGLNYILIIFLTLTVYFFSDKILIFFKTSPSELPFMTKFFKTGLLIPFFIGISYALKQLLFALNKNAPYIRITVGTTVLSMFSLPCLIYYFGLQGAFISTIFIEIVVIMLYCMILKSIISLK